MKESKFIDLKSDYAFKVFFGTPENKVLTINFLNSLLGKSIRDISYHNVEMQGLNADSRKAVFDLFCEGDDGEFFVVEMQKRKQEYFSDRVLYYASFAIQMQANIESERFRKATEAEKKRWNYHINKVYVVCFLDYMMEREHPDKYLWNIVRMDRELKIPFSETLNEVYIELPKFRLEFDGCDSFYKQFLAVMNNSEIMNNLPNNMNNEALFQKLKSAIELQRMSAKERLAYELSIAADRDLSACMASSYKEGKAEGKAEEKQKIIRAMSANGLDLPTIAKITQLSEQEVKALLE